MIEGKSKDDEVPMTERQKARGKACLVGGLISVVVIALCGLVVYRGGGGGGRPGTDGRMYYYGSSSYESEVSSGGASGGWLEQARAFLSNATGVEAMLGTTDDEQMFPTI
jgi:hypothetical protein